MEKNELLDKMREHLYIQEKDVERARLVLKAVEGLSILEARRLLEGCMEGLQLLEVVCSHAAHADGK